MAGEVRPTCTDHLSFNIGWVHQNGGTALYTTIIPLNYDSCRRVTCDPQNLGQGDPTVSQDDLVHAELKSKP